MPVEIAYGTGGYAVMMLTPADLVDFAYGFSLTEGVIGAASDIRGIEQDAAEGGLRLRVELVGSRLHAHLARRRALTGRTGCGVCGITDIAALPRSPPLAGSAPTVRLAAVQHALGGLETLQPLGAVTRAVHGAAWCGHDGTVHLVREDVGRHNALDKLVGALLRDGRDPAGGFLLITSRASFEMVEKAGAFGCRTLVAISAPTALAVARAQALDITLVGIARPDGVTVFHGRERLAP